MRGVCLAVLCFLILYGTSPRARGQELGYSQRALVAEQQRYEQRLEKARAQINLGKDRLGAGLAGLAEAPLVSSSIVLDVLQTEMFGHQDRVSALRRAPLSYNREKEITRLLGTAREQESRRARMGNEVQALCLAQGPALTNTWPGLALYLSKRKDFALAFQAKPALVADLLRLVESGSPPTLVLSAALGYGSNPAAVTPPATITNKVVEHVTITNTVTVTNVERVIMERPATNGFEISRQLELLRQQGTNIVASLAALRTNAPPAAPKPPHAALTRDATPDTKNLNAPPQPARPPPGNNTRKLTQTAAANGTPSSTQSPVLSPVLQQVTNTLERPLTNTLTPMENTYHGPSRGPAGTNMAVTSNQAHTPQSNTIVAAQQGSHNSATKMDNSMTLPLIALGVLVAISAIVWLVVAADRTWMVSMLTNGERASYEIQGSDRLVLDGIPHGEHHSLVNGHPHIRPTWKGATIHPGVEPLVINGAPVLKPQKLNPNDRITAHAGNGTIDYDFLDCVSATEQASEE